MPSYCITILSASALYVVMYRENKRRNQLSLDQVEKSRSAFRDFTDKKNPYFVYVL